MTSAFANSQFAYYDTSYPLRTNYLTVTEYQNAPQALDLFNLLPGGNPAAQVQASEKEVGAIDTTTIRSNAAKVAFDYQTKSTMDLNQATLDTMAGINAKTAGDINAASSVLGTVGSVATKWGAGKSAGLFGSGTINANPLFGGGSPSGYGA